MPQPPSPSTDPECEILDWCEKQHEVEERIANKTIVLVLITLLIGILLLLTLPRLLTSIDYFWRTDLLPPTIIEKSRLNQQKLDHNLSDMEHQLVNAENFQKSISDQLDSLVSSRNLLRSTISADLSGNVSLFRAANITDTQSSWTTWTLEQILDLPPNGLLAAGHSDTGLGSQLLLLHSTDGLSWAPIQLQPRRASLPGALHSLVRTTDGVLYAVGYERFDDKTVATLVLRSTDGQSWELIRPHTGDAHTRGKLHAIVQTTKGSLFAAGYESTERDGDVPLILRSTNGTSWTPVRWQHGNALPNGVFNSLVQTIDGVLFVAGHKISDGGTQVPLIIRSRDGILWTPVRAQVEPDAWKGAINSVMQTSDGVLFAAGYQDISIFQIAPMLLRSTNGTTWDHVTLHTDTDTSHLGQLHSLSQTTAGTLIAVGTAVELKVPTEWNTNGDEKSAEDYAIDYRTIRESLSGISMFPSMEPSVWHHLPVSWPFQKPTLPFLRPALYVSSDGVSWSVKSYYGVGLPPFLKPYNVQQMQNNRAFISGEEMLLSLVSDAATKMHVVDTVFENEKVLEKFVTTNQFTKITKFSTLNDLQYTVS